MSDHRDPGIEQHPRPWKNYAATMDDLQQAGVEHLKRRIGVKPQSRREQEHEECELIVHKLVAENVATLKYCSAMNVMHPPFSSTNVGFLARALFDAYRREDALRDLIRLAEAPDRYGPAAGVNTIDVSALKRILDGGATESPRLKDGVETIVASTQPREGKSGWSLQAHLNEDGTTDVLKSEYVSSKDGVEILPVKGAPPDRFVLRDAAGKVFQGQISEASSAEFSEILTREEFAKRYPGAKVPDAYFIAAPEFETSINPDTGNAEIIVHGKSVGDTPEVREHPVPFAGPAPSQHEEGE